MACESAGATENKRLRTLTKRDCMFFMVNSEFGLPFVIEFPNKDRPIGFGKMSSRYRAMTATPVPIDEGQSLNARREVHNVSIFHGDYCSGTFENIYDGMPSDNTSGSDCRRGSRSRGISARTLTLNDLFWLWQKSERLHRRSKRRLLL